MVMERRRTISGPWIGARRRLSEPPLGTTAIAGSSKQRFPAASRYGPPPGDRSSNSLRCDMACGRAIGQLGARARFQSVLLSAPNVIDSATFNATEVERSGDTPRTTVFPALMGGRQRNESAVRVTAKNVVLMSASLKMTARGAR